MEKTYSNEMTTELGNAISAEIIDVVGKSICAAANISSETDRVIAMTPKDGYQKKIELITAASDLSTREKIKAIDDAETKYAQDLAINAEICKGLMWAKAGAILTGVAGVVLMVTTPEGKRIAKAILKLAA